MFQHTRLIVMLLVCVCGTSLAQEGLPACKDLRSDRQILKVRVSPGVAASIAKETSEIALDDETASKLKELKSLRVVFLSNTEGRIACFDIVEMKGASDPALLRLAVAKGLLTWQFKIYEIQGKPVFLESRVRLQRRKNILKPEFEKD